MQERQGVSFRRLSWVAALLTALMAAGAYLAYMQLLHYRRSAAEHLPPNTLFAARLDVEQVILFDPIRRHLLPLVEALPPAPARPASAEQGTRLARLRAVGLNLGLDLRELLVAVTADHGWLVAAGGLFPESGMLDAVEQVLQEESAHGWQRAGELLEFTPSGAALGQAADGTLLLASDRATLRAALPASAHHAQLGLPREGAGGAVLTPDGAQYLDSSAWGGGVRGVVASLRLARDLELELQVALSDSAQAHQLAARARQWTTAGPGPIVDRQAGGASLGQLWARARSVEVIETSVKSVSSWRPSELERSARELAAWVRRQLPASERAGS